MAEFSARKQFFPNFGVLLFKVLISAILIFPPDDW
jgi:hypothetical protein